MTTDNGLLIVLLFPVLAGLIGIGVYVLLQGGAQAVRSIFE